MDLKFLIIFLKTYKVKIKFYFNIQITKRNIKCLFNFIKNSKFHKILNLTKLANKIKKYCKNKKKIVIIIEGASWAGYSYFLYKLLKK